MNCFTTLAALLALVLGVGCGKKASPDGESSLGFARDIKGVLSKFCFECHGVEHQEAKLDLRTVESILAGGESGAAIVPGKPEESILFEMIHDGHMPPEGKLPGAADIERIRQWIVSGAQP
ncbi:MAG: hypothetical protein OSB29_10540 [Verrucomicrobiota bacterium]|nr:hypothetical protein [Verrucomicrobiota bacterium]